MEEAPIVAIVGPTAAGKTALSIDVARRVHGEIISMDSRQVYRGMDIGTAKATPAQRASIPHHGLDLVDPDERFSAGRFARYAREKIDEIRGRHSVPILVGGTGFFLRALTHPIFREPPLDADRRRELEAFLSKLDDETLIRWLARLDPAAAEKFSRWGGRQRILRALELPLLTGRPLSWWQANAEPEAPPIEPLVFVLDLPRDRLDDAISRRIDDMMEAGLVDEVADLLQRGYNERAPGMNATGYIELIPYLRGEVTLPEAVERIRRNTRAYSRRQLTWLRNQLPPGAIWLDATAPRERLVDAIADRVENAKMSGRRADP